MHGTAIPFLFHFPSLSNIEYNVYTSFSPRTTPNHLETKELITDTFYNVSANTVQESAKVYGDMMHEWKRWINWQTWFHRYIDLPGLTYLITTIMTIGIFTLTRDASLVSILLLLPIMLLASFGGWSLGILGSLIAIVLTAPYFDTSSSLVQPPFTPLHWLFLSGCYVAFGVLVGWQSETMRQRRRSKYADFETQLAQATRSVEEYEARLEEMSEGQAFLTRMNEELAFLNVIATTVNSTLDVSEVQAIAIRQIDEMLQIDEAQLYWISATGDSMVLQAAYPLTPEEVLQAPLVHAGEGELGRAIQLQQSLSINNITGNVQLPPSMSEAITSITIIPLRSPLHLSGVLALGRKDGREFTPGDEHLLESAGRVLAVAIENAKLYKQTHDLSLADPLTGLANRRMFNLHLSAEITRAHQTEVPLCLIIFDLDHFKNVNDEHGHLVGDEVLRYFSQRVLQDIRSTDMVCRYGGEEFALIAKSTSLADAAAIAERICRHLENEPMRLENGNSIAVTVSAGVALLHPDGENDDDLIAAADKALYCAKMSGRNRVVIDGDSACPQEKIATPRALSVSSN